jgi:hypothetical protein
MKTGGLISFCDVVSCNVKTYIFEFEFNFIAHDIKNPFHALKTLELTSMSGKKLK